MKRKKYFWEKDFILNPFEREFLKEVLLDYQRKFSNLECLDKSNLKKFVYANNLIHKLR